MVDALTVWQRQWTTASENCRSRTPRWISSRRTDEPVWDGCEIPPTDVASGVVVMGAPSRESPPANLVALEARVDSAEVVPPVACDTGLSALSCEAFVALSQLEDRHISSACPRGLTEHPLLQLEGPELETQMVPVRCDNLRTGPTQECTKWRTSG